MDNILHICVVAGARPNFMKVAPLVWAVRNNRLEHPVNLHLVYTGDENDLDLEPTLLADLALAKEEVCFLGVVSNRMNELTGRVMEAFDLYLEQHPAQIVVVVDDLASTLAAAIVTKKRGLTLAHLVAGTRSFDITMPKEINRLVIDGLSDLLFTAGDGGSSIVSRGGADPSKVFMVGNVLIDTLRQNLPRQQRPALMDEETLQEGHYIVLTLNRKALLADSDRLKPMLLALTRTAVNTPVIAVLRPDASETVRQLLPERHPGLTITQPLSYLEFIYLTSHARGIVTDSGNVAEEATFNNIPCITLNSYTEHLETVKQGSNVLVGEDADRLEQALKQMSDGQWKESHLPDRWDGRSADRIIRIIVEELTKH